MNVKAFFVAMLFAGLIHSAVVINSLDWRDVVSGVCYAYAKNDSVVFFVGGSDPTLMIKKMGGVGSVFLIESKNNPAYAGLDVILINNGNSVEVYKSEEPYKTNVEIAKKSGAENFILINSSYGYPAVSVLSYAKLKNSCVLFADSKNFESIGEVLKDAKNILLYGAVDPEVRGWLDGMGKEYERIDTGNKYGDNIEVVDRYFSLNPSKKQVLLTDGNFLEGSIVSGDDPVILISPLTPDITYNYMKEGVRMGRISSGLVVGEEYAISGYSLKKRINSELGGDNFSVLVKMNQKIPGVEGVIPLDIFPIPGPVVSILIKEADYNEKVKAVEVVYANSGNTHGYFKTSSLVYVGGEYFATIGDSEPVAIGPGEEKGVRYGLEIPAEIGSDVVLNSTIIYGGWQGIFDHGVNTALNVSRAGYEDTSLLLIDDASYNPDKNELTARIKNAGSGNGYFLFSVEYLEDGEKKIFNEEKVYELPPGETGFVRVRNFFIKDLISAGMKAKINYGARVAFLDKTNEKEVRVGGAEEIPLWIVAVLVIAIGGAGYLLFRNRKRRSIRKEEKPLYRRIGLG